jgi:tripartite-type tricarboxylate transporter receptor subunit TctC
MKKDRVMRPNIARMMTLAAALALAMPAHAQNGTDNYPSRPIRMIVPLSPGTTTDLVARTIGDAVSRELEQPVIVENKQGAGGTLAAKVAAMAAPDGYTILMVNSQHSINPAVYQNLPYDTLKDFAGLALVAQAPSAVIVSPKLGVTTLKEFIAFAKQHPDTINYASSGIGSQTHLAGAYFASQAGISMVHVPYRDSSQVIADLLAGRVQASFVPLAFVLGQVQEGKLLALAVTSRDGIQTPINAPSVSEAALPGYEYNTWFGFLAPAKVPPAILERLSKALQDAANTAEVKEKLSGSAIFPQTLTLREFDDFIKADVDKQKQIANGARIEAH